MADKTVNQEAIALLDEAAFTSSLIKNKERKSGDIKGEHLYPATREEALKMQDLLAKALEAAKDPDEPEFREKYNKLKGIVDWSLAKHRTWTWALIAGVALSIVIMIGFIVSFSGNIKESKALLKIVKTWTPPCDSTVTWDRVPEVEIKEDASVYASANTWRAFYLSKLKSKYAAEMNLPAEARNTDKAVKYRKQFDDLAASNFDGVQKLAKKYVKGKVFGTRQNSAALISIVVILIALIILYIWTGKPYGYEITRSNKRNKILTGVRKAGFWLAGLCFGTALVAKLFSDKEKPGYVYSSERREKAKDADVAGTALKVTGKVLLAIIGIGLFLGVSLMIILFEALGGLPAKLRALKAE